MPAGLVHIKTTLATTEVMRYVYLDKGDPGRDFDQRSPF
jgi:hypothetical protein